MTKDEIIKEIATKTGIEKPAVEATVEAIMETIKKSMVKGKNGKNARFDQSSPEHNDHLTLLIVKKILWSTKIGRGWST